MPTGQSSQDSTSCRARVFCHLSAVSSPALEMCWSSAWVLRFSPLSNRDMAGAVTAGILESLACAGPCPACSTPPVLRRGLRPEGLYLAQDARLVRGTGTLKGSLFTPKLFCLRSLKSAFRCVLVWRPNKILCEKATWQAVIAIKLKIFIFLFC